MKKIIIETLVSSQKTAILEDDKLVELLIEDNKKNKIVSNIYRGIVKKVHTRHRSLLCRYRI